MDIIGGQTNKRSIKPLKGSRKASHQNKDNTGATNVCLHKRTYLHLSTYPSLRKASTQVEIHIIKGKWAYPPLSQTAVNARYLSDK